MSENLNSLVRQLEIAKNLQAHADSVQVTDSAELLRELMDASAPYLRRKKMTPRHECNALNDVWKKCDEHLKNQNNLIKTKCVKCKKDFDYGEYDVIPNAIVSNGNIVDIEVVICPHCLETKRLS